MFAREGKRIIIGVALVVVLSAVGGWIANLLYLKILMAISLLFFIFCGFFFRDPRRTIPIGDRLVLAPADGKVVYVGEEVIKQNDFTSWGKQVSIFLSIFNVHTNRIPISGVVTYANHTRGKFLAAFKMEATEVNEQTEIHIHTGEMLVKVKQIAGILARRIICYLKEGDRVTRGSRLGYIRFGSRTDLIMPAKTKVLVSVGDRVKGGETIIGELI